jgi:hypothetical protein
MSSEVALSARFWLGMALPTIVLALVTAFLVLVAGQGREAAPLVVLAVSVVALPAAMLANGWVLFAPWRPAALIVGGFAVPVLIAVAMALYIQGSAGERQLGATMLAPFFAILAVAAKHPVGLLVAWGLALAGVILAARRRRAPKAPLDEPGNRVG